MTSDTTPSATAVSTQQAFAGRPPSATTSRLSMTGHRDYGMKFDLGADEMTNSGTLSRPGAHAQGDDRSDTAMSTPPETEADTAWGPPPYQKATSRQGRDAGDEGEETEAECHPFWMSWADMARGIALIITGALKIPFVIGHGIAKILWYIPVAYGDDTVWEWPNITGFPSACKASVQVCENKNRLRCSTSPPTPLTSCANSLSLPSAEPVVRLIQRRDRLGGVTRKGRTEKGREGLR